MPRPGFEPGTADPKSAVISISPPRHSVYGTVLCYDLEMSYRIPPEVSVVSTKLREAGFEAYLVGGCVRDLIIGLEPKDWDVTTNATPEQIQAIFL